MGEVGWYSSTTKLKRRSFHDARPAWRPCRLCICHSTRQKQYLPCLRGKFWNKWGRWADLSWMWWLTRMFSTFTTILRRNYERLQTAGLGNNRPNLMPCLKECVSMREVVVEHQGHAPFWKTLKQLYSQQINLYRCTYLKKESDLDNVMGIIEQSYKDVLWIRNLKSALSADVLYIERVIMQSRL